MSATETHAWSIDRRSRSAEPRGGGGTARDVEVEMMDRAEADGSRFKASISEADTAVEKDGDEEGRGRNIERE